MQHDTHATYLPGTCIGPWHGYTHAVAVVIALALVVIDQLVKVWAVTNLTLGEQGITVVPGFLYLSYVQNTGAAFGMLQGVDLRIGALHLDGTFLLGLLSLAVSVTLATHLLRRGRGHDAWTRAALTLILAGAAGNMIDRLRLGYVVDYVSIDTGSFRFAVFNLADACISVGAVLLIAATLFVAPRHEARAAASRGARLPATDEIASSEAVETSQLGATDTSAGTLENVELRSDPATDDRS